MGGYDVDLFVIGGGSGGVRAARVAASHGARVAIAEQDRWGGTCVVRGCIPKKLFVYASELGHDIDDAASYGWQIEGRRFDWPTLLANKDREIERLSGVYVGMLSRLGVEVIAQRAVVVDPHTIEVAGRRVTSRIILVATGSKPWLPRVPGIEHAITSDGAFHLPALPGRIAIIGGGYIAVEFAGIFSGLGCDVALVHRWPMVLSGFDRDVRAAVCAGLTALGVELHLETTVSEIAAHRDGSLRLRLSSGAALDVDAILCATGRVPNTAGMGLAEAGVALSPEGAVIVDVHSRSSVDSIYAVGDVTDRINLTPVAIHEGHAFADSVFGRKPRPVDHHLVASAVFSQPPVAAVGLTEDEARKLGPIDVYTSTFRPLRHTLTGREQRVMMKLVVDEATQRVVGAHIVGRDAPEIMQTLAVAVKMGATKADLDATMAIHPTTAEEFVLMRDPT